MALLQNNLELHYQPIVDTNGDIYAEEALLRLVDGDRPIAAIAFIDSISKDPGLMSSLLLVLLLVNRSSLIVRGLPRIL